MFSILGAARSLLPPEWALCLGRSVFCSRSVWIISGCGYSCHSSYVLDVRQRLNFVVVSTLILAGSSWKGIGIVVFPALTVLGRKVVPLQALNPPCCCLPRPLKVMSKVKAE
jgi:hypothetical protein